MKYSLGAHNGAGFDVFPAANGVGDVTLQFPCLHLCRIGRGSSGSPECGEIVGIGNSGSNHVGAQRSSSGQYAQGDGSFRFRGINRPWRGGRGEFVKGDPLGVSLFVCEIGVGDVLQHGPLAGSKNVHRALEDHQTGHRKHDERHGRLDQHASTESPGEPGLELSPDYATVPGRVKGVLMFGVVILHGVSGLRAAEPLQPPFGLSWGDSPTRLVEWAVRTSLDQTVKAPAGQPRLKVLLVAPAEGALPGHEATELEARFMDGKLFEVALHYTYPGRKSSFVRGQFAELKKILTRRHGPLQLGAKAQEAPKEGVLTKLTSYRVEPASGRRLLLVLTEVSDAKRGDSSARFSVIYHNGGVLQEEGPRVIIRREGVEFPVEP